MNEDKCHNSAWQWRWTKLSKFVEGKLPGKWTITVVLASPKCLWEHKIESGYRAIFLIFEDHLFRRWYFGDFDLVCHSHRHREYDFHTCDFPSILELDNDIFPKLIFDFYNRRIKLHNIWPIELRLIFLQNFKHMLLHFTNKGHHPLLDFEPINSIMNLFTIQPQQLHTTIIINQLQYRKIVTTNAL